MEFVLRPKIATIKVTHPDGSFEMCSSASHVAEVIRNSYGVPLSKFQATRLCNLHSYKRPKFSLPEGIIIERLNSTKVTRRNRERISGNESIEEGEYWQNLGQNDDATDAQRNPEQNDANEAV
jgi:hypothetical protein